MAPESSRSIEEWHKRVAEIHKKSNRRWEETLSEVQLRKKGRHEEAKEKERRN